MILFRLAHPAYPFIWESPSQPAARWHAEQEGPVHYFATTPEGAWAEIIRHEEITEPEDLSGLREMAMWVVRLDEPVLDESALQLDVLTGGLSTYPICQEEARNLRERGSRGMLVPSAALLPGGAFTYAVDDGPQALPVPSYVVVLFGPAPHVIGQLASVGGHPRVGLLEHVRPLSA